MNRERVLVIDDNPDDLTIIRETLSSLGIHAMYFQKADEAKKAYEVDVFNLVLVDERMPGEDGLEVIRELQKIVKPANVRMVVISGCDYETISEMAKRRNVKIDGHIYKDRMAEALKAVLQAHAK